MRLISLFGFAFFMLLAGCATAPPPAPPASGFWLDREFSYQPSDVTISKQQLFALDDELLAQLRGSKLQSMSMERRVYYLMSVLLESKARPFAYSTSGSTVAKETWATRRGDCLSLTVLAYAMAEELRLNAAMQEVTVAPTFDRRSGIDFLVGHVNVHLNRVMATEYSSTLNLTRSVVIDFEPVFGSARIGTALSDQAILSRFYNNLGAEFLARREHSKAYAYFKAAIEADPQFTAAVANLATLYALNGHVQESEKLLLHALRYGNGTDVPMRGLHKLMLTQGRVQEAAQYQERLIALQDQNPYFWIDKGMTAFNANQFGKAITAFERAQELTTGFAEVHRFLAAAYVKEGQLSKAQQQIKTLAQLDSEDPSLSVLKKKMQARL